MQRIAGMTANCNSTNFILFRRGFPKFLRCYIHPFEARNPAERKATALTLRVVLVFA